MSNRFVSKHWLFAFSTVLLLTLTAFSVLAVDVYGPGSKMVGQDGVYEFEGGEVPLERTGNCYEDDYHYERTCEDVETCEYKTEEECKTKTEKVSSCSGPNCKVTTEYYTGTCEKQETCSRDYSCEKTRSYSCQKTEKYTDTCSRFYWGSCSVSYPCLKSRSYTCYKSQSYIGTCSRSYTCYKSRSVRSTCYRTRVRYCSAWGVRYPCGISRSSYTCYKSQSYRSTCSSSYSCWKTRSVRSTCSDTYIGTCSSSVSCPKYESYSCAKERTVTGTCSEKYTDTCSESYSCMKSYSCTKSRETYERSYEECKDKNVKFCYDEKVCKNERTSKQTVVGNEYTYKANGERWIKDANGEKVYSKTISIEGTQCVESGSIRLGSLTKDIGSWVQRITYVNDGRYEAGITINGKTDKRFTTVIAQIDNSDDNEHTPAPSPVPIVEEEDEVVIPVSPVVPEQPQQDCEWKEVCEMDVVNTPVENCDQVQTTCETPGCDLYKRSIGLCECETCNGGVIVPDWIPFFGGSKQAIGFCVPDWIPFIGDRCLSPTNDCNNFGCLQGSRCFAAGCEGGHETCEAYNYADECQSVDNHEATEVCEDQWVCGEIASDPLVISGTGVDVSATSSAWVGEEVEIDFTAEAKLKEIGRCQVADGTYCAADNPDVYICDSYDQEEICDEYDEEYVCTSYGETCGRRARDEGRCGCDQYNSRMCFPDFVPGWVLDKLNLNRCYNYKVCIDDHYEVCVPIFGCGDIEIPSWLGGGQCFNPSAKEEYGCALATRCSLASCERWDTDYSDCINGYYEDTDDCVDSHWEDTNDCDSGHYVDGGCARMETKYKDVGSKRSYSVVGERWIKDTTGEKIYSEKIEAGSTDCYDDDHSDTIDIGSWSETITLDQQGKYSAGINLNSNSDGIYIEALGVKIEKINLPIEVKLNQKFDVVVDLGNVYYEDLGWGRHSAGAKVDVSIDGRTFTKEWKDECDIAVICYIDQLGTKLYGLVFGETVVTVEDAYSTTIGENTLSVEVTDSGSGTTDTGARIVNILDAEFELTIETNTPSAKIVIGGTEKYTDTGSPYETTFKLSKGSYDVVGEKNGHLSDTSSVVLDSDRKIVLTLKDILPVAEIEIEKIEYERCGIRDITRTVNKCSNGKDRCPVDTTPIHDTATCFCWDVEIIEPGFTCWDDNETENIDVVYGDSLVHLKSTISGTEHGVDNVNSVYYEYFLSEDVSFDEYSGLKYGESFVVKDQIRLNGDNNQIYSDGIVLRLRDSIDSGTSVVSKEVKFRPQPMPVIDDVSFCYIMPKKDGTCDKEIPIIKVPTAMGTSTYDYLGAEIEQGRPIAIYFTVANLFKFDESLGYVEVSIDNKPSGVLEDGEKLVNGFLLNGKDDSELKPIVWVFNSTEKGRHSIWLKVTNLQNNKVLEKEIKIDIGDGVWGKLDSPFQYASGEFNDTWADIHTIYSEMKSLEQGRFTEFETGFGNGFSIENDEISGKYKSLNMIYEMLMYDEFTYLEGGTPEVIPSTSSTVTSTIGNILSGVAGWIGSIPSTVAGIVSGFWNDPLGSLQQAGEWAMNNKMEALGIVALTLLCLTGIGAIAGIGGAGTLLGTITTTGFIALDIATVAVVFNEAIVENRVLTGSDWLVLGLVAAGNVIQFSGPVMKALKNTKIGGKLSSSLAAMRGTATVSDDAARTAARIITKEDDFANLMRMKQVSSNADDLKGLFRGKFKEWPAFDNVLDNLRKEGVTVVENADEFLDAKGAYASFDPGTSTLYIGSKTKTLDMMHELRHFSQARNRGLGTLTKVSDWDIDFIAEYIKKDRKFVINEISKLGDDEVALLLKHIDEVDAYNYEILNKNTFGFTQSELDSAIINKKIHQTGITDTLYRLN
jgi:hypothetical protein